jgi:hypothetical protein
VPFLSFRSLIWETREAMLLLGSGLMESMRRETWGVLVLLAAEARRGLARRRRRGRERKGMMILDS